MRKNLRRIIFIVASMLCLTGVMLNVYSPFNILTEHEKNEPYTIVSSGAIVERDLNNLVETSTLIAVGKVVTEPESLCVRNVYGYDQILNDRIFVIDRVLMGNEEKESITVRQQGGTIGLRTEIYSNNPTLEEGKNYLLFLHKPDMGGSFNTEGDYYYVRGLCQGAYEITSDGTYMSHDGTELSEQDLNTVLSTKRTALYSYRNTYLANQKSKYEKGIITKEAYDQAVALTKTYAAIIPESEAVWH